MSRLCARSRSCELFPAERVGADALDAVLKLLFAEILKGEVHLAADVFIHLAADADTPWLGKVFEAGSDVDAVAIDADIVKYDITLVDANAEAHAASFVYISIALRHCPLDCYRALDCVHDAAELSEDAVTGGVNDTASVLFDHGENDGLMLLETANRVPFIRAHECAVTSDVGRKNCCQSAGNLGLLWSFRHFPVARAITRGNSSTLPDGTAPFDRLGVPPRVRCWHQAAMHRLVDLMPGIEGAADAN